MFCPNCSESKTSSQTIFCTKCGFDLTGLDNAIERGGLDRGDRRKSIKLGITMLMLGVLLIPVWMFIGAAFPPADRLVEGSPSTTAAEAIAWILMWMSFLAGAARIAYAFVFENAATTDGRRSENKRSARALNSGSLFKGLKPGRWKASGDLVESASRTSGDIGGRL